MIPGNVGTATPVDLSGQRRTHSALAAWLLHLPGQAIAWDDYCLSVIHLAPILGEPEPIRVYPEAEFEMLVVALDPDHKPDANDPEHTFLYLEPVNYSMQFHGVTDMAARRMCRLMARAFCDGYLPAEPMRTTIKPAPVHPGGLVVPGEATTINIGDGPKIVDWNGTQYTARELFNKMVLNTVEHERKGGHPRYGTLQQP